MQQAGIETVAQFLKADPEELADKLNSRHITADTLIDWQCQARLVCSVPGLRGGEAQLIVAADVRDAAALSSFSAKSLHTEIQAIAATSEGQRILRDREAPDLEEISGWIAAAGQARKQAA